MAAALQHLGACSFCGNPLWPVDGKMITDPEGEHWILLECMIRPDDQCTVQEFKISDIFGE